MFIINHSKDVDGWTSGAICKLKYPEAKVIEWDYKDEFPDFKQFENEEVIMVDVTFPLNKIVELKTICKELTIIDHHISFKKEFDSLDVEYINSTNINYFYKDKTSASELAWEYLFPEKAMPYAITLIGRYDTWRLFEGDWKNETLPFSYFTYSIMSSSSNAPYYLFDNTINIKDSLGIGKTIMEYQERSNKIVTKSNSFEREVFGGLRALCINYYPFSSEILKSKYEESKHDIMIGFCFSNNMWIVSLRTTKEEVDCSVIARQRGGGGHRAAAGFEVKTFEEIFI